MQNIENEILETEIDEAKEQYMLSLFTSIEKDLITEFKQSDIKFSFSKNFSQGRLLVKARFKKRNNLNPTNKNIDFLLFFAEYYPETPPKVLCITNFCFPNLSDGRDLFPSLFTNEWKSNLKVTDIIMNLGQLILRTVVHNKIQICTNIGKFYPKDIYDLNEILSDCSNELFKCYVETEQIKNSDYKIKPLKRYIIISDSQLLIFSPHSTSKNLGNLIFTCGVNQIEDLQTLAIDEQIENKIRQKDENLKEEFLKRFIFIWKNSDIYIPNSNRLFFESGVIMKIDNFFHLYDKISLKKKKLLQSFELFSDDYHKHYPVEKLNINDESKLVELCMYQEKSFLRDYFSDNSVLRVSDPILIHQAREVVFFYKKLIELMEYKNDMSIVIYKNKLNDFKELTGYAD